MHSNILIFKELSKLNRVKVSICFVLFIDTLCKFQLIVQRWSNQGATTAFRFISLIFNIFLLLFFILFLLFAHLNIKKKKSK